MTELVPGVLALCHCGRSSLTWIEHEESYVCVHDALKCLLALPAVLEELERASEAATAPDAPRGAYARRQARGSVMTTPSRICIAPRGQGSPFHVPGMMRGAPWTVLTETNFGHLYTPCNVNEKAARAHNDRNRVMSERGWEIGHGAVYAVGGAVVTPTGEAVETWGRVPVYGSPRWRPITRASYWMRCAGCSRQLWPGCVISVSAHCCVTCMASEEGEDPRVWPQEPGYPGDDARPDHLKKADSRR